MGSKRIWLARIGDDCESLMIHEAGGDWCTWALMYGDELFYFDPFILLTNFGMNEVDWRRSCVCSNTKNETIVYVMCLFVYIIHTTLTLDTIHGTMLHELRSISGRLFGKYFPLESIACIMKCIIYPSVGVPKPLNINRDFFLVSGHYCPWTPSCRNSQKKLLLHEFFKGLDHRHHHRCRVLEFPFLLFSVHRF